MIANTLTRQWRDIRKFYTLLYVYETRGFNNYAGEVAKFHRKIVHLYTYTSDPFLEFFEWKYYNYVQSIIFLIHI